MIGNNFCSVRYLIGIRTGSLIPITFFRHITCIHRDVWQGQTYDSESGIPGPGFRIESGMTGL